MEDKYGYRRITGTCRFCDGLTNTLDYHGNDGILHPKCESLISDPDWGIEYLTEQLTRLKAWKRGERR